MQSLSRGERKHSPVSLTLVLTQDLFVKRKCRTLQVSLNSGTADDEPSIVLHDKDRFFMRLALIALILALGVIASKYIATRMLGGPISSSPHAKHDLTTER